MLSQQLYFKVMDLADLQTQHSHTDAELMALKVLTRGQGAFYMEKVRSQSKCKLSPGFFHLSGSLPCDQHVQCHQFFIRVSMLCM